MMAATANADLDGETIQVGFWDVITSVSRSDFKVELQLSGDIPPGHDKLMLTFPFVKANQVYAGRDLIPLRRTISDHEVAVAKHTAYCAGSHISMGPKTTSQARLDLIKAQSCKPKSCTLDKETMLLAKHLLS